MSRTLFSFPLAVFTSFSGFTGVATRPRFPKTVVFPSESGLSSSSSDAELNSELCVAGIGLDVDAEDIGAGTGC
jgi:hypothetical protein